MPFFIFCSIVEVNSIKSPTSVTAFIRYSFVIKAFTIATNCTVYIHTYTYTYALLSALHVTWEGLWMLPYCRLKTRRGAEYMNVVEKNVAVNRNSIDSGDMNWSRTAHNVIWWWAVKGQHKGYHPSPLRPYTMQQAAEAATLCTTVLALGGRWVVTPTSRRLSLSEMP
jgi:hypothetical protein